VLSFGKFFLISTILHIYFLYLLTNSSLQLSENKKILLQTPEDKYEVSVIGATPHKNLSSTSTSTSTSSFSPGQSSTLATTKSFNETLHDNGPANGQATISPATIVKKIQPHYPKISRQLEESGKVVISLKINAAGKITMAKIIQASGYKRLDEAALLAAKRTKFSPAFNQIGPVASEKELVYLFQLRE